jgi:hypothetical protein
VAIKGVWVETAREGRGRWLRPRMERVRTAGERGEVNSSRPNLHGPSCWVLTQSSVSVTLYRKRRILFSTRGRARMRRARGRSCLGHGPGERPCLVFFRVFYYFFPDSFTGPGFCDFCWFSDLLVHFFLSFFYNLNKYQVWTFSYLNLFTFEQFFQNLRTF